MFPDLNEENWKEELNQKRWDQEKMPYVLKIENNTGYNTDCHFCGNHNCRTSCPLPYNSKLTVLDMLNKVGADDNVSFYSNKGGKSDFILNLNWNQDFEKVFQKHLSSVQDAEVINTDEDFNEDAKQKITISDCFNEFKREEMLDEDNMWYCSNCKDHV